MKNIFIAITLVTGLVSCSKFESKNKKEKEEFKFEYNLEGLEACSDNSLADPTNYPSNYKQYILEELHFDETCGCYTKGYVKYLDIDKYETVALVKYGEGECDGHAIKIDCIDGKCDEDNKCKITLNCRD